MKRVVISGANGFLGSAIIKEAIKSDKVNVVAVTSKPQEIKRVFGNGCNVVLTEMFLNEKFPLFKEDVFINCLFPTNADGYKMANGLDIMFKIMSVAKKCGTGAFINISSQSVYASNRLQPAIESDVLSLETGYAVGKYCSEAFCNQVFQGMPHTSIRLASLLGVGYDQRIINRMVEQALKGTELKVVGGMQRYGFLDVRDAALGIMKIIMSDPEEWKLNYNLGRMESYTLIEVVESIVEQLKNYGVSSSYVIEEGIDTRNSSVDASQFMNDFRWEPVIPLSQTIADIIENKLNKVKNGNL